MYSIRNMVKIGINAEHRCFVKYITIVEGHGIIVPEVVQMGTEYSLADVSKFIGASESLVLEWIQQGRFPGVSVNNPEFKPDTAYVAVTGVRTTLAEIEENYHREQKRLGRDKPITSEEGRREVKKAIRFFEEKYGGSFEKTLAAQTKLSGQEERDAAQWSGLLKKLRRPGGMI